MTLINKPRVSKGIAWSYGGLTIFVGAMIVFFACASVFTPMGTGGAAASVGSTVVGVIMFRLWRSLYKTRYVLTDEDLIIETTKLIGGGKRIRLNAIESLERTLIPVGVKLFGASFHGGYYKIPVIGTTFMAITNLEDGLLIQTTKGNYIITPKNPLQFKETVERTIHRRS